MLLAWIAFSVLLRPSLVSADELPIVGIIREAIYEEDQRLAETHQDERALPDLGLLPWDPIKLRNGRLGNFSTAELIGEPVVTQDNEPDGTTIINFDMTLGLGYAAAEYDFTFAFFTKGHSTVRVGSNSIRANFSLSLNTNKGCKATLRSVKVTQFQDYDIEVTPHDLPMVTNIEQSILNFLSPKLLPITNFILKELVAMNAVKKKFEEMVCGPLSIN